MTTNTLVSYGHGTSTTPLMAQTIGENLEASAERVPERDAVVSCHQALRLTYADFNAAVDRLATGLLREGIEHGDRVGIWSPNCAEWSLVQYATAKVGAILVNINPAYRAHELDYVLRQSGIRLLISSPGYKTSDYREMANAAASEIETLERIVFIGDGDWDEIASTTADQDGIAARASCLSFDDPINIQYTSGTTGSPKGATLTHHNILNNAFFVGELLNITERDRICVPVPFYHCFGMVIGNLVATSHSACVVVPAPTFEPEATLAAVQSERCTALYGVPTMFIAELEHPRFVEFDLSSLRTGIMAGSPCPVEVMQRVVSEMNMSEISICYGMTETSPVSTQTRIDDRLELRVGTVGRPVPHVEVKIVEPATGRTVPRGERGELCTRGYSVMLGYWEEPDKTAEAIDAAGWMHTGDLATMDVQGYCNIVGRLKDMVIRGGENIYPREVEEFLYSHRSIADVQIVGVPDERLGEELCAWIRLREGAEPLDAPGLSEFCEGKLAHYKIPRYVIVVDEFPMTVTGKVQKYKMREESIARLGLDVGVRIITA
jgi:fatty-acyl-CoA synthase